MFTQRGTKAPATPSFICCLCVYQPGSGRRDAFESVIIINNYLNLTKLTQKEGIKRKLGTHNDSYCGGQLTKSILFRKYASHPSSSSVGGCAWATIKYIYTTATTKV